MDNLQNKSEEKKDEESFTKLQNSPNAATSTSAQAEPDVPPTMHPHHKMVYVIFFIVLFFVIALIALVKYAPMGDTFGKAIDVLNSNAKCEDTNGVVKLSDSPTNVETYQDSCAKGSDNGYFATDYSCNTINNLPTVKKVVNICSFGCDGVVCKQTAQQKECIEKASYCSGNNLVSFSCVEGESLKKVMQCGNGCNAETNECNVIN
ncbi:hypothetical protein HZA96_07300 [Candidatus Woesearchaeota archaeon]|nr:hypothetical protein [Candidatus Woesearchaeota archaeon]